MKYLILIRHGQAVDPTSSLIAGLEDAQRPLTEFGVQQIRDQAEKLKIFLNQQNVAAVGIISSPLLRAVQTADLIEQHFVDEDPSQILTSKLLINRLNANEAFAPDEDPELAATTVRQLENRGAIVIATHLPMIEELSGFLVSNKAAVPGFHTGDALVISCEKIDGEESMMIDKFFRA